MQFVLLFSQKSCADLLVLGFNEESHTIRVNGLCGFVIWGPEKQTASPVGVNRMFLIKWLSKSPIKEEYGSERRHSEMV